MPQLQSRYLVTLRTAAGRDFGQFQTFSGGEVTAESVPDRYPGQEYPDASGGEKTIAPIVIGRRIKIERDNDALRTELRSLAGADNAMIANVKPLDKDRNPYGKGETYTGTLIRVSTPETDSNSDSEPAMLEVEIQPSNVQ